MTTVIPIVGDVAIFPDPSGGVVLRAGSDGRTRMFVPAVDRERLARAIAGDGFAVVPVAALREYCDATWVGVAIGENRGGER